MNSVSGSPLGSPLNKYECEYKTEDQKIKIEPISEQVYYPCTKCEYKATTKKSLKIHRAFEHEGIKYNCNECEYKANAAGSLKRDA